MIAQQERISYQPAREAVRRLEERLEQFDLWAITADRAGDGWESDFPEWLALIQEADQIMAQKHLTKHALLLLGRCWTIMEEDEICADWAREHIQKPHVQELVRHLTKSVYPETRWQACSVLGDLSPLDSETVRVLEGCLMDDNPYVRRRAFLALEGHSGIDCQPYLRQMLSDTDSYNRFVAVRTEGEWNDTDNSLRDQVQSAAQDPAVAALLAAADNYEDRTYRPISDKL